MLIIDPDSDVTNTCFHVATGMGFEAFAAPNLEAARTLFENMIDVILIDATGSMRLQRELLHGARSCSAHASLIIMTGSPSVDGAVSAMQAGAIHYLPKPFSLAQLIEALSYAAERPRLVIERKRIMEELRLQEGRGAMIGRSFQIERTLRWIARAATSNYPVLITGEFGVGKQHVAQKIHEQGVQAGRDLVKVDCRSTIEGEMERILFGYKSGGCSHAGILDSGACGTILFDEVSELSLHLQARLVHSLEQRGNIAVKAGSDTVQMPARVLATTSIDIEALVRSGRFRKDLLLRLKVLDIIVPPLRDRVQDVSLLISSWFIRNAAQSGRTIELSQQAHNVLTAYSWPGNLRELTMALEHACAVTTGLIVVADLPKYIRDAYLGEIAVFAESHVLSKPAGSPPHTLDDLERDAILDALSFCKGDKLEVCKRLGIGKTTLYRKLKEYGMRGK
jgi:two-component system response regulator HydG